MRTITPSDSGLSNVEQTVYHSEMHKSDSHSGSQFTSRLLTVFATLGVVTLLAAACGDDADDSETSGSDTPTVVVTTNILGDVVENLLGDAATVETVMPTGAAPHEFRASAQQVATIGDAEVLVVNGAGIEEGLLDPIEAAETDGVPVCVAIDAVEPVDFEEGEHADEEGEHSDEEHADEEGEHGHEHEGADPHFFTDPARMAAAAGDLTDCILAAAPALDTEGVRSSADAYVAQLEDLDEEVEALLAAVPDERRVLVTNHEVFGYFADRYGFEVAGAILPVSTQSEASASQLAELAELVEEKGVPAVFADTSSPNQLAEALAAEVGEVEVAELFSESLGPDGGETYIAMVRTNAERIADALG